MEETVEKRGKQISSWTVHGMTAEVVSSGTEISAKLTEGGRVIRSESNFMTWNGANNAVDRWVKEILEAEKKKGK